MRILLFLVLFVSGLNALSCDNCNVYLGLNPNDFYHNFGVRLRTRYHQGSFDNYGALLQKHGGQDQVFTNSTVKETYQRAEITGQYFWNPKWNTQIILPYVRNTQEVDATVKYFVQGIGDVIIMQNYMLFNTKDINDSILFKHRLTIGLGVKLPTGSTAVERPLGVPGIDLQPGTGSWDGLFSSTYTAMYKKSGFALNANVKVNTFNQDGFRYGHTLNLTAKLFQLINLGESIQLMPNLGVYSETFSKDYFNFERINASGGSLWMLDAGVNCFIGSFKVQGDFQYAIRNQLKEQQQLPTNWRYNVGIYYNF